MLFPAHGFNLGQYYCLRECAQLAQCRDTEKLTRRVDRLRPDRWTRMYSTKSVQLNGAKWSS